MSDPSSGLTRRRGLLQSYDPAAPMTWTGKPFAISVGVQGEPHGSTFTACGNYDYDTQVTLPDGRFVAIWDDARGAVLERRVVVDPFDFDLPVLVLNAGCSRVWGAIVS